MSYLCKEKYRGFTLVELLVVIVIVAILGALGFTKFITIRQKQAVINTAHTVQAQIDSARSQSIAAAKDVNTSSGEPSMWGVMMFPDKSPPNQTSYFLRLGPYDPNVNPFNNNPPGTKTLNLQKGVKFCANWGQIDDYNKFGILISFDKLSGMARVNKVSPSSQQLLSTTYGFGSDLVITMESSEWYIDVSLMANGVTELGKITKISGSSPCTP